MSVTEINCPNCGELISLEETRCPHCNTQLLTSKADTLVIKADPNMFRVRRKPTGKTGLLSPNGKVLFLEIRGLMERLTFPADMAMVLGRVDMNNPVPNRFDLTPFGARERGVSREHAVMRFQDNILTITDLGSANGTFVNDQQLTVNSPHVLKDGDRIMLGALSLTIRYEIPVR